MKQPVNAKRPHIPFVMIRMFFFGIVAVFAAAYGVVRYYTHPRQPMRVPVPALDAAEIPAPELVPVPASS